VEGKKKKSFHVQKLFIICSIYTSWLCYCIFKTSLKKMTSILLLFIRTAEITKYLIDIDINISAHSCECYNQKFLNNPFLTCSELYVNTYLNIF